jgi:hypothetical protein
MQINHLLFSSRAYFLHDSGGTPTQAAAGSRLPSLLHSSVGGHHWVMLEQLTAAAAEAYRGVEMMQNLGGRQRRVT